MAAKDIRPFGATDDGRAPYFIQRSGSLGSHLQLVVIDEWGDYETQPVTAPFDPAAPDLQEAIVYHLKQVGTLARAEADLDRRKKNAPEPEPPPPPMSPATREFYDDDSYLPEAPSTPAWRGGWW